MVNGFNLRSAGYTSEEARHAVRTGQHPARYMQRANRECLTASGAPTSTPYSQNRPIQLSLMGASAQAMGGASAGQYAIHPTSVKLVQPLQYRQGLVRHQDQQQTAQQYQHQARQQQVPQYTAAPAIGMGHGPYVVQDPNAIVRSMAMNGQDASNFLNNFGLWLHSTTVRLCLARMNNGLFEVLLSGCDKTSLSIGHALVEHMTNSNLRQHGQSRLQDYNANATTQSLTALYSIEARQGRTFVFGPRAVGAAINSLNLQQLDRIVGTFQVRANGTAELHVSGASLRLAYINGLWQYPPVLAHFLAQQFVTGPDGSLVLTPYERQYLAVRQPAIGMSNAYGGPLPQEPAFLPPYPDLARSQQVSTAVTRPARSGPTRKDSANDEDGPSIGATSGGTSANGGSRAAASGSGSGCGGDGNTQGNPYPSREGGEGSAQDGDHMVVGENHANTHEDALSEQQDLLPADGEDDHGLSSDPTGELSGADNDDLDSLFGESKTKETEQQQPAPQPSGPSRGLALPKLSLPSRRTLPQPPESGVPSELASSSKRTAADAGLSDEPAASKRSMCTPASSPSPPAETRGNKSAPKPEYKNALTLEQVDDWCHGKTVNVRFTADLMREFLKRGPQGEKWTKDMWKKGNRVWELEILLEALDGRKCFSEYMVDPETKHFIPKPCHGHSRSSSSSQSSHARSKSPNASNASSHTSPDTSPNAGVERRPAGRLPTPVLPGASTGGMSFGTVDNPMLIREDKHKPVPKPISKPPGHYRGQYNEKVNKKHPWLTSTSQGSTQPRSAATPETIVLDDDEEEAEGVEAPPTMPATSEPARKPRTKKTPEEAKEQAKRQRASTKAKRAEQSGSVSATKQDRAAVQKAKKATKANSTPKLKKKDAAKVVKAVENLLMGSNTPVDEEEEREESSKPLDEDVEAQFAAALKNPSPLVLEFDEEIESQLHAEPEDTPPVNFDDDEDMETKSQAELEDTTPEQEGGDDLDAALRAALADEGFLVLEPERESYPPEEDDAAAGEAGPSLRQDQSEPEQYLFEFNDDEHDQGSDDEEESTQPLEETEEERRMRLQAEEESEWSEEE